MESARIFLAEPDNMLLTMLKCLLAKEGHTVVLEARDLKKALEIARQVRRHNVQLAIIDAFSQSDYEIQAGIRPPGALVAAAVKQVNPQVAVIVFTCDYIDDPEYKWVPKEGKNIRLLLKAIADA